MSHTPHELAEEFPEHITKMSALKQSDAHFATLFDSYHEVNRTIHRPRRMWNRWKPWRKQSFANSAPI